MRRKERIGTRCYRILLSTMLHEFVIDKHRSVRFHLEVVEHLEFD